MQESIIILLCVVILSLLLTMHKFKTKVDKISQEFVEFSKKLEIQALAYKEKLASNEQEIASSFSTYMMNNYTMKKGNIKTFIHKNDPKKEEYIWVIYCDWVTKNKPIE